MTHSQGLKKRERLKRRKLIKSLFQGGDSTAVYPIRVVWKIIELPEAVPSQVGFSVAKKRFRHAVSRNAIKRQLFEAFRKQRHPLQELLQAHQKQCALMLLYTSTERLSSQELEQCMHKLVQKMCEQLKREFNTVQ